MSALKFLLAFSFAFLLFSSFLILQERRHKNKIKKDLARTTTTSFFFFLLIVESLIESFYYGRSFDYTISYYDTLSVSLITTIIYLSVSITLKSSLCASKNLINMQRRLGNILNVI